uniref:SJCHGC02437 protein n=1 Tax=Schistosoma japonicum TaxID=6182 RepID=Q5D991_SCHJA|nr:SJCHGC02437 protein [Schistosoma japonicum]
MENRNKCNAAHSDLSQLPPDVSLEFVDLLSKLSTCDDIYPPSKLPCNKLTFEFPCLLTGVEEKSSWSNVVTKSSICGDCNSIVTNLIDNVSKPSTLPPRIHYSELYSARPFRDSSTIQSSNMVSESLCMDSWLTNLSRVSSHDLTNVNRSSPPPLPPKKVVTPSI